MEKNMKKVLFAIASLVMVSGSTIGAASATTWYGTGSNFGGGWATSPSGNSIYGTGNNFGGGWAISPGGNSIYGTGSNFGSGFIIR